MFNINMNVVGDILRYRRSSMILLLTLLMAVSGAVQAQPSGLDDDPGTSVPVDGGISLLLASGFTYGLRRIRSDRKSTTKRVKDRPGS